MAVVGGLQIHLADPLRKPTTRVSTATGSPACWFSMRCSRCQCKPGKRSPIHRPRDRYEPAPPIGDCAGSCASSRPSLAVRMSSGTERAQRSNSMCLLARGAALSNTANQGKSRLRCASPIHHPNQAPTYRNCNSGLSVKLGKKRGWRGVRHPRNEAHSCRVGFP